MGGVKDSLKLNKANIGILVELIEQRSERCVKVKFNFIVIS